MERVAKGWDVRLVSPEGEIVDIITLDGVERTDIESGEGLIFEQICQIVASLPETAFENEEAILFSRINKGLDKFVAKFRQDHGKEFDDLSYERVMQLIHDVSDP